MRTSNGANTTVGFYIPFQFVGFPIRITGPTIVQPYTDFPVNADVLSPSLIPPVTYSWTRNGSPLYYTGDYFSYPGSDMGVDHEFGLTVTDSEGQTLTATHYVHTLNCVGEGCIEQ